MYLYEMHCHTSQVSACARVTGREIADFYKFKLGCDGVCITDHFLNGNTTVKRDLPWAERVELFMKGYEDAAERGKEIGLKVFFGLEFSLKGTDFLTYGIDKQWLLDHPYCDELRVADFGELVHRSGGFYAQAHPYREANYIEMIRLFPRCVDAVEVVNANRDDFTNGMAEKYATAYGLRHICGSDNHTNAQPRYALLGLEQPAESIEDILNAIRADKQFIYVTDAPEL